MVKRTSYEAPPYAAFSILPPLSLHTQHIDKYAASSYEMLGACAVQKKDSALGKM